MTLKRELKLFKSGFARRVVSILIDIVGILVFIRDKELEEYKAE